MSINFPLDDNSTQYSGTFIAGSVYSGFTTSNYINNILTPYDLITDRQTAITNLSSTLQSNINIKQNILTSTSILSGIGSNITLIDYNNIYNIPPTVNTNNDGLWKSTNNTISTIILTSNIAIGTSDSQGYKFNILGNTNLSGAVNITGFINQC